MITSLASPWTNPLPLLTSPLSCSLSLCPRPLLNPHQGGSTDDFIYPRSAIKIPSREINMNDYPGMRQLLPTPSTHPSVQSISQTDRRHDYHSSIDLFERPTFASTFCPVASHYPPPPPPPQPNPPQPNPTQPPHTHTQPLRQQLQASLTTRAAPCSPWTKWTSSTP